MQSLPEMKEEWPLLQIRRFVENFGDPILVFIYGEIIPVPSNQNFINHFSPGIRQPERSSLELIGEFLMIESKLI